jgi:putative two-component system response regulator
MTDKERILFVDDEKRILEVYSDMLVDLGYHVETAANPGEAMALISDTTFDIIFIDQFLGPVQGIALMQQMQKADIALYFVIMTANPNTELAVEALKQGASDFISKPLSLADLMKSIEYVNRKRELDRQRSELLSRLESRVKEKTDELNQVYFSVLSAMAMAVEKKDLGTFGHSMRVSRYCRGIAEHLGIAETEMHDLTAAALLHDIGKIGISDSILGKRGPLGRDEIEIVRGHPQNGVEILKPLKQFTSILPAILHHHERHDGSGYPMGLSGESIPLLARIIAVADTYDAIVSDRPYRPAAFHEEALRELFLGSGTQFDPVVARAFIAVMQDQKSTIVVPEGGIRKHGLVLQAQGIFAGDDTTDEERSYHG